MPIDLRALAPAPLATTSGATPRMNANDVMMIGRNRCLDRGLDDGFVPVQAAVARHVDDQNGILGGQRDQQDDADLGIEIVADAQRREHQHRPDQRQRH